CRLQGRSDGNTHALRRRQDDDGRVRARQQRTRRHGVRQTVTMKRAAALGCAAIIVGVAGAYWGRVLWTARVTPSEPPRFATAEMRTIAATVVATGIVRLRVGADVRVGSQVSGIVKTLNVTVGSHIRAGDVIAEIDSRPLEARVAQGLAQAAV